jgi:hypothetical protein
MCINSKAMLNVSRAAALIPHCSHRSTPPTTTTITITSPLSTAMRMDSLRTGRAPPDKVSLSHLCQNVANHESTAAADSILPSLTFATHPALSLSKPMNLTIPAHPRNTQQSVTVTVPSTHYYFQITPHVPVGLTNRPYRLFVTVNGQRVSEYTKPGTERIKDRPLFEARLERGMVNRIEVEVLAGKANATKGGKEEVELEKCTLYVHVLRT